MRRNRWRQAEHGEKGGEAARGMIRLLDISTMSPFVMLMPSRMGGDSSNTSILWVLELPPQMEMVKHLHRKRDQNSTLNYKKVKYSYLKILKKEMPSRAHHQHIHQGHIWATHVAVQPQPSQEAAPSLPSSPPHAKYLTKPETAAG